MPVVIPTEEVLREAELVLQQLHRYEVLGRYAGEDVTQQKLTFIALALMNYAAKERDIWKDRYEAERQAHEATIAHADREMNRYAQSE